MSTGEIVIACYRPQEGKKDETMKLAEGHYKALKALGFVTERKPLLFLASDHTIVEIFEWASGEAFDQAHDHPEVQKYWEKMAQVCSFVAPSTVSEMQKAFSHFKALN